MKPSVYNCNVIELSKIHNRAGNITPIHGSVEIPFDIKRVYYLYDVPGGEIRGGHAHYELKQLIVAASGSFDVVIDDGSHNIEDQVKTHYILKDYMAEGSIYIIEDIQDIDAKKHLFWEGEIIDRRHIKNRYDDILVIYRY